MILQLPTIQRLPKAHIGRRKALEEVQSFILDAPFGEVELE